MSKLTYEQLMQNYVNAPYSVLLSIASESIDKLMPIFKEASPDGNGASVILPFMCVVVAVDGKFSELEYKFITELTGIEESYEGFKAFVQNFYNDKWAQTVDDMIDRCPDDVKQSLLCLALSLSAVDEKISREENSYIAKLII